MTCLWASSFEAIVYFHCLIGSIYATTGKSKTWLYPISKCIFSPRHFICLKKKPLSTCTWYERFFFGVVDKIHCYQKKKQKPLLIHISLYQWILSTNASMWVINVDTKIITSSNRIKISDENSQLFFLQKNMQILFYRSSHFSIWLLPISVLWPTAQQK